ncbi:MAG: peptidylprolyl isomerase [Planctomycetaceae bacterium]|nr:peptidylprolyl isomerase [Planctomycetaceae bacterium]
MDPLQADITFQCCPVDAPVTQARPFRFQLVSACSLAMVALLAGCHGKSIKEDNPVFAAAPARVSMLNHDADAQEIARSRAGKSGIAQVSFADTPDQELTGTSVVAEVNGHPIFVDDVLDGFAARLEQAPDLSAAQRDEILRNELRKRLSKRIDEEIVLDALYAKIPEDRRQMLQQTLEGEPFEKFISFVKQDAKVESDADLEAHLARQNVSIDDLRRSFVRFQMTDGFLQTLASTSNVVDRSEIVSYYEAHRDEYTSKERVRVAEIVVRFDDHGGRQGAEEVMTEIVTLLQQKRTFSEVAEKYSGRQSAQNGGDIGWLARGDLSDRELEQELFLLEAREMTPVMVRPDRFEVYQVIQHERPKTRTLAEMQQDIEAEILKQRVKTAKGEAMEGLRSKAVVQTIFDSDPGSPFDQ